MIAKTLYNVWFLGYFVIKAALENNLEVADDFFESLQKYYDYLNEEVEWNSTPKDE